MKKYFLILIFLSPLISFSNDIKVQLLPKLNCNSLNFVAEFGNYTVFNRGAIIADVLQGEWATLNLDTIKDSMELKVNGVRIGYFGSVKFLSADSLSFFSFESLSPRNKKLFYDDGLIVNNNYGIFQIINELSMDDYLAGVVEAEVGHINDAELFQVQAIISRTYAMKYLGKNSMLGFDFVDDVYDQAFKGRNKYNPLVRKNIAPNHGIIIVDTAGNPISAAFYSNSGGETSNSEDYWMGRPDPNLRGIMDSFSVGMQNYRWEKKLSKLSWKTYLASKGISENYCLQENFHRTAYFYCNDKKISTRTIREDLKLKSNYFSIYEEGDFIIIKGKGFGHGIGLSQEGAAKMAKLGFSYEEIILFYYTNVHLKKMELNN